MSVFAQTDFYALFPDIFDPDTQHETLSNVPGAPCATAGFAHPRSAVLFPCNFSADTEDTRLSDVADAPRPGAPCATAGFAHPRSAVLFPCNFSADTEDTRLSDVADAPRPGVHASGMDPCWHNDDDLSFLCLDSGLQRWERLALDNQAQAVPFGFSVAAFERVAGDEGKSWKRDLQRLQPYGSTLMRDRMLQFACRHDLHTHLISPRTVTGYVEAWLAYTNVDALVQEVHARQQGMHPATHRMLREIAHDMYRQAMLAAATGERKRAVWFYDTNARKKRKMPMRR